MTKFDSAGGFARRGVAAATILVSPFLLAGCADRVVAPVGRAAAERVGLSGSAVSATDTLFVALPTWKQAVEDGKFDGCLVHYRRWNKKYTPVLVDMKFSDSGWDTYGILVYTMARTENDGEKIEELDPRIGIRAVCLFPLTELGKKEALEQVEVLFPPDSSTQADRGPTRPTLVRAGIFSLRFPELLRPDRNARSLAAVRLGEALLPAGTPAARAGGRLHLARQEIPELPEIVVTVYRRPHWCAAFDWDEATQSCHLETTPPPPPPPPAPPPPPTPPAWPPPAPPPPPPPPVPPPPPPPPPVPPPPVPPPWPPPVKPPPITTIPEFMLECDSVERGLVGGCSVSLANDANVNLSQLSYAWTAGGLGGTTHSGMGASSWTGTAASDIAITVEVSGSGVATAAILTGEVTVTARNWTWPAGENLGDKGTGLDGCAGWGGAMGITVGRLYGSSCATTYFDRHGYEISAGSGPWSKKYFVSSTTDDSRAGAYWAYNPVLRTDGPAHDTGTLIRPIRRERGCRGSANVRQVNACSSVLGLSDDNRSAAFDGLVEETASHEESHINAMIAESGNHNVWGRWESAVGSSEAAVRSAAINSGGTNPAVAAQSAMHRAVAAVDSTYTAKVFEIWWWTGSEWDVLGIRSGH